MMQKVSQGPYRVIKTIELIVIEPKKNVFLDCLQASYALRDGDTKDNPVKLTLFGL